ncbi:5624_t:CDS:2, partial [Diversispora eburnea]
MILNCVEEDKRHNRISMASPIIGLGISSERLGISLELDLERSGIILNALKIQE